MQPLPVKTPIQFANPTNGTFELDTFVDPTGDPITVIDHEQGFTVTGIVTLPGWLSGKGVVRLVADEIGGPFDGAIGSRDVPVTGATSPQDPQDISYPWTITVPGTGPELPPATNMYQLGLVFMLETNVGGHTDIAGFFDLGAFLIV